METTTTVSVLIVIVAVTVFIVFSFHSGKRKNKEICTTVFHELVKVFKPDEQTFTNIGGTVGHHGTFSFKERGAVSRIDVTLTLLPRQATFYMPISNKHIAIVLDQRKGFIFMGLRQEPIEAFLAPDYEWLFSVFEPYG